MWAKYDHNSIIARSMYDLTFKLVGAEYGHRYILVCAKYDHPLY